MGDFWLKNPKLPRSAIRQHSYPPYWMTAHRVDRAMAMCGRSSTGTAAVPGNAFMWAKPAGPVRGDNAGRQTVTAESARFTREFCIGHWLLPTTTYDQPWKKRLEGTVGGYWGLYDAQGREKFPLTGPVIADPTWWRGMVPVSACATVAGHRVRKQLTGRSHICSLHLPASASAALMSCNGLPV
jgi:hypothetical protein